MLTVTQFFEYLVENGIEPVLDDAVVIAVEVVPHLLCIQVLFAYFVRESVDSVCLPISLAPLAGAARVGRVGRILSAFGVGRRSWRRSHNTFATRRSR